MHGEEKEQERENCEKERRKKRFFERKVLEKI